MKDGMEITQRGAEAPSLGPSGFISLLTECALPCRLAGEWGRADVVSADHGISKGISAPGQAEDLEQRWWVGNIFCHKRQRLLWMESQI